MYHTTTASSECLRVYSKVVELCGRYYSGRIGGHGIYAYQASEYPRDPYILGQSDGRKQMPRWQRLQPQFDINLRLQLGTVFQPTVVTILRCTTAETSHFVHNTDLYHASTISSRYVFLPFGKYCSGCTVLFGL